MAFAGEVRPALPCASSVLIESEAMYVSTTVLCVNPSPGKRSLVDISDSQSCPQVMCHSMQGRLSKWSFEQLARGVPQAEMSEEGGKGEGSEGAERIMRHCSVWTVNIRRMID